MVPGSLKGAISTSRQRAEHDATWLAHLERAEATAFGPAAFAGLNEWIEATVSQFALQNQSFLPGLSATVTPRPTRIPRQLSATAWIPEGALFFQGVLQKTRWIVALRGDFGSFARGLLREKTEDALFESIARSESMVRAEVKPVTALQVGLVSQWFLGTFLDPWNQGAQSRGYEIQQEIRALKTARPPLLHGWGWICEIDHLGNRLTAQLLLPDEIAEWPELGVEAGRDLERAQAILSHSRLEVRVHLGKIRLGVNQLSRLKPGDCLVLDQPINEPLAASIGGTIPGQVWPGRVGQQVAIQWEALAGQTETGEMGESQEKAP